MLSAKAFAVQALLRWAGIKINGNRPWDIVTSQPAGLLERMAQDGASLGLGEAYMGRLWECRDPAQLEQMFQHILRSKMLDFVSRKWKLYGCQGEPRAIRSVAAHYNLGHDLYGAMLDASKSYSCPYRMKELGDLAAGQAAKWNLGCRKLGLKAGDRVLNVGCGWAPFERYAAHNFDATVVGVTIAEEQGRRARELCARFGDRIDIRCMNYADLDETEKFDHIASFGMFEHLLPKDRAFYFSKLWRLLKPRGRFLLHTIGKKEAGPTDPWTAAYIFPDSQVPTEGEIREVVDPLWAIHDWHAIGVNYAPALRAWKENFYRGWPKLRGSYEHLVDGRFYRMWEYYLTSCAAAFEVGALDVWQILMTKTGDSLPSEMACVR